MASEPPILRVLVPSTADPRLPAHTPRNSEAPAIDLLARHGIAVSIVTNQSAVARGELDEQDLRILHEWLKADLVRHGVPVVGVFTCVHDRNSRCRCRKPAPGLLLDAMTASGIAPANTALVGDAIGDLDAADAAGVRSILVRTGKGIASEAEATRQVTVTDDLHAAVRLLLDENTDAVADSG